MFVYWKLSLLSDNPLQYNYHFYLEYNCNYHNLENKQGIHEFGLFNLNSMLVYNSSIFINLYIMLFYWNASAYKKRILSCCHKRKLSLKYLLFVTSIGDGRTKYFPIWNKSCISPCDRYFMVQYEFTWGERERVCVYIRSSDW